jgi:hypothetical protein
MPDVATQPLTWEIDVFVLVRGRVLQLQCYDVSGASLAAVPALRATALGWAERVRAANRGEPHRRGRIAGGAQRPQSPRPRSSRPA